MTADEWISEHYPDADLLLMDGYNDCVLGVCESFNRVFVVYDKAKVLEKLRSKGDCGDYDEAHEYWSFNQLGAWVGDATPGFVTFREGVRRVDE